MSTNPTTPIEFFHRPEERPTTYRWYHRLADHWRGRRDGRFLNSAQSEEAAAGPGAPGSTENGDLIPTPWVRARVAEVDQVDAREQLTLERVLDALFREHRRLVAEVSVTDRRHTQLSSEAAELEAHGPASSEPRGAGEALETEQERAQRRARTHAVEVATLRGQVAALDQRRGQAQIRIGEIEIQVENAKRTCARRCHAARAHAERRVATYARGMQRVAPKARLVQALSGRPLFAVPRPLPAA